MTVVLVNNIFAALYPRPYHPSFAMGACVLAVIFASIFSLIFPLVGPAVAILLFLTLIGERLICARFVRLLLTLFGSSSISCWLCVCSHTFTNRRFITNMAATSIWHAGVVAALAAWVDFVQQAVLDRRRRPCRCCSRRHSRG
jgi:hypothetical protein